VPGRYAKKPPVFLWENYPPKLHSFRYAEELKSLDGQGLQDTCSYTLYVMCSR